jgi:hypothetical protein
MKIFATVALLAVVAAEEAPTAETTDAAVVVTNSPVQTKNLTVAAADGVTMSTVGTFSWYTRFYSKLNDVVNVTEVYYHCKPL